MLKPIYSLEETERLIAENTEKIVMLPWNGNYIPFKLRMLNSTQMKACGDFSVVSIANEEQEQDNALDIDKGEQFKNILSLKNTQEKMLEMALVSPTFDEICNILNASDLIISIRATLAKCDEAIKTATDLTMEQTAELVKRVEDYKLYLAFLYPEDFIGAFVQYIVQREHTDIDIISRKILLEVGLSADKFGGRPSDFLEGNFTEYQKQDMDKASSSIVFQYREDEKTENNAKDKWHRNKKKFKGNT